MNVISIFKVGVLLLAPPARCCYHVKNHIDLESSMFPQSKKTMTFMFGSLVFFSFPVGENETHIKKIRKIKLLQTKVGISYIIANFLLLMSNCSKYMFIRKQLILCADM